MYGDRKSPQNLTNAARLHPAQWRYIMFKTMKKYRFLLSRLIKRDFIQKYKKTVFGVVWSVLNPLCEFFILMLVFSNMFGRDTPHFTTYLLLGVFIYSYYTNATTQGMQSFLNNGNIMNKIKLPTWLFPLSKNISALLNFLITFLVVIAFMFIDNITFTWKFVLLLYPFVLMFFFNLGFSLILASLYVFFKDTSYLYGIFNRLLYYCCAIFWTVNRFPDNIQHLFLLNPVYDFIYYARTVVIDAQIPGMDVHLLMLGYTVVTFVIGLIVYNCNKNKFIFYL
jgi:ABC-2 type transport system permease protein